MRGGLYSKALKNLTESMFNFSLVWWNLHLNSLQTLKYPTLINLLNTYSYNSNKWSPHLVNLQSTFELNSTSILKLELFPTNDFDIKSLFLVKLLKFNPLFNFYIEKVDKNIRKNSRNKANKLKIIWRYVPPYKRLYTIMTWFLKDLKFQKSRLFQVRVEKAFETLFLTTNKTFIWKLKNFIHFYVFKNFKHSLFQTLRSTSR
jgi:hypothetical protein